MFQFANQPLSIFRVASASLKLYAKTFTKVWYVFVLYWLIGLFWLIGYATDILPSTAVSKTAPPPIASTHPIWFFILMCLSLLITLLGLYLRWVALHRMNELAAKPVLQATHSWRVVKNKYLTLFGNQLLVTLMLVVTLIPFVVPGVFLGGFLLFCAPLILFSDASVTGAIKESCALVWGHWWRVFSVVIIPFALSMLIGLILPYLVKFGLGFKLFGFALGLINSFVIMPIFLAVILVQFNDLKLRKKA